MELRIRNGKAAYFGAAARLYAFFALIFFGGSQLAAQVPTCTSAATSPTVHAEGLAEKLGDLTLSCSGGSPGSTANLNLFVGLNINITNSTGSSGTGIVVSVNGTPAGATAQVSGGQSISINGLSYTVPATGVVTQIAISNIRGAVAALPADALAVLATVGGTGANFVSNPLLPLGVPMATLLSSTANNGLLCAASPLPTAPIDLAGLISTGTCASALRVTEAYFDSFNAGRGPAASNGPRLVVNISGYPASGARVFVPDVLVGSSGSSPTAANAFGAVAQLGSYTPGTAIGQLLLVRVDQANASGAGGNPVLSIPSAATTFSSAFEVPLVNGAATVTYEILESSANARESVQIPVYVAAGQVSAAAVAQPSLSVRLGPVSTVATGDSTSPIPRFLSTAPKSDCTVLNDCSASYFPSLTVDTAPVTLSGLALGAAQSGFIRVGNGGGGLLTFTASVTYPAGSAAGWLKVTPASGFNNVTVVVTADPASLAQGSYAASVVIDAGPYGTQTVPVTFTVGAPGLVIQSLVSAASFAKDLPLTPGSIGALFGLNLNGKAVGVTFDGLPSQIFGIYNVNGGTQQQINLLVPPGLGSKTSAKVVVTVDGQQSNTYPVSLAANSPGIFNPGILNQDSSVNLPTAPTTTGKIIAVYMTGLTVPLTGQVTVKIGGLDLLIPQYAGEAPTLTGLQQVNVLVPSALTFTGNSAPLAVCIPALDPTQRVCSPTVPLYLTQ